MADEPSVQDGQEPAASTTGQEPTTPASTLTLEQALEALAATRREAAGHRARATTLEKAQKAAEDAKLSDIEKATRERDTIKAELEAERLERRAVTNRYEVQLAANRLGIVDPDAAVKLLDWGALEYSDDGKPKNIDQALTALLKAKPYLAAQTSGPPTSAMNPATGRGGARVTAADLAAMRPEDIVKRFTSEQVGQILAGT